MVKVGDFGLARDVYAHLYYRADKHSEIPVKWSAPEMLTDGLSTEMSDVVSLAWSISLYDDTMREICIGYICYI